MPNWLRPRSVYQLVLIALVMVAMPLLAVVITAIVKVDNLAVASDAAVLQADRTARARAELGEQLAAMERSARQYRVLRDDHMHDAYVGARANFLRAARDLEPLAPRGLAELRAEADELDARLQGGGFESDEALQRAFARLARIERDVAASASASIIEMADAFHDRAAALQRALLAQAAALIPAAIGLAALFAVLIREPLQRLNAAIQVLGRGDLGRPIRVQGPASVEELGERLEWLRKRLLDLETQKLTFLRAISHELKTPLASIRAGAQLLLKQDDNAAERHEVLGIIADSSRQLHKLIEDLLQNAALRPMPLTSARPLRLDTLLADVIESQRLPIAARSLQVERNLESVWVRGHEDQLRILFNNVLGNAVKYSPAGGRFSVVLAPHAGRAVVDVHDTGPGVPAEDRERVFEPFQRGAAGLNGAVAGTGLGLTIARDLARLHEGTIEIMDASQGTHVRVSLPLATA
jgi:two-component system, NtrC family, sensor histidine kinase GlrK